MISQTISHYRILEKLGEGGMGVVYKAEDTKLKREVAIKFLPRQINASEEERERFKIEAQAAAALNHPNIATIHAIEEVDDEMFIVMEYIDGRELRKIVGANGRSPLPIEEIIEYAGQIASGLQAAHERGVIHRDIKSANIMITKKGQVKIMDFGLAKVRGGAQLTRVGTRLGTAAYMSPEQARGEEVGERSDIWSFGVVFYEMLTGHLPFQSDYEQAVIYSILYEEPPFPSAIPVGLHQILQRALAKDSTDRYQDMATVLADLNAFEERPAQVEAEARRGAAHAVPSILVLPFINLSSEKENEYFSDGMTEELIDALTKVHRLRVVSRTSAFAFKGKEQDIREIGTQLNVNHVIEGSVRKAGDRLRITAQLIKVSDGYHLWSEKYDRELNDIFEIQDEISANIVEALQVALSKAEKIALGKASTSNVEAYDYYLRGRQFTHEFRQRSMEYAQQMFVNATNVDPNYALAYGGIADCHSWRYQWWDKRDVHLKEAERASMKALELDPNLAEVHVARGWAISLSNRHAEAEEEFETAIRLNPRHFEAYYLYARSCFANGQAQKAAELFERAHAVRPEDYQSVSLQILALEKADHKAKATAAAHRTLEVIGRHLSLNPDDARALGLGAHALLSLGQRSQGLEWANRASEIDPDGPTLYNVACAFSSCGELDMAIDCLEKAVKTISLHREWLENDPDMDPLRSNARFQNLLAGLK
jgi:serine/threonine protein kinase/Tfp pilus assembly protein PilF